MISDIIFGIIFSVMFICDVKYNTHFGAGFILLEIFNIIRNNIKERKNKYS